LANTNQSSRRILLADDEPLVVRVMTRMLVENGYQVVAAKDGREAFRILQSDAEFRAAFFDLQMPHLMGIDLIRYMRTEKRLIRIPVILMTGDQSLSAQVESFAAGAMAFLMKPITNQNMQTILRLLGAKEGAVCES